MHPPEKDPLVIIRLLALPSVMILLPNLRQRVPHGLPLVALQERQDLLPEGGG